jgi:hypothetical protein
MTLGPLTVEIQKSFFFTAPRMFRMTKNSKIVIATKTLQI